jgi:hypothetical protein
LLAVAAVAETAVEGKRRSYPIVPASSEGGPTPSQRQYNKPKLTYIQAQNKITKCVCSIYFNNNFNKVSIWNIQRCRVKTFYV